MGYLTDMLSDLIDNKDTIAVEELSHTENSLSIMKDELLKIRKAMEDISITEELISSIKEQGVICQEDVKMVETYKPGLLGDTVVLEQFTVGRTDIFFPEVVRYLNKRLSLETTELRNVSSSFFKTSETILQEFYDDLISNLLPAVRSIMASYVSENQTLKANYSITPNSIFAIDGEFINIMTSNIHDLVGKNTGMNLSKLSTIVKDMHFISYMDSVLCGLSITEAYEKHSKYMVPELSSNICLKSILKFAFYEKHNLDELESMTYMSLDTIKTLNKQIPTNEDSISAYIVDNYEEAEKAVHLGEYSHDIAKGLYVFYTTLNGISKDLSSKLIESIEG